MPARASTRVPVLDEPWLGDLGPAIVKAERGSGASSLEVITARVFEALARFMAGWMCVIASCARERCILLLSSKETLNNFPIMSSYCTNGSLSRHGTPKPEQADEDTAVAVDDGLLR